MTAAAAEPINGFPLFGPPAEPPITSEEITACWEKTLQALQMFGWNRFSSIDPSTGRLCVSGAINLASGYGIRGKHVDGGYLISTTRVGPHLSRAAALGGTMHIELSDKLREKNIHQGEIFDWNDNSAVNEEEILSVISQIINERMSA